MKNISNENKIIFHSNNIKCYNSLKLMKYFFEHNFEFWFMWTWFDKIYFSLCKKYFIKKFSKILILFKNDILLFIESTLFNIDKYFLYTSQKIESFYINNKLHIYYIIKKIKLIVFY